MSETKKLQGKVAVITGGTTGIGLAAAKLFVKEGACVFITGRRQKELDEAVTAIGCNVTGIKGDIAKLPDLDHLYETVEAKGDSISFSPMPASLNLLYSAKLPRSILTYSSTSTSRELYSRCRRLYR